MILIEFETQQTRSRSICREFLDPYIKVSCILICRKRFTLQLADKTEGLFWVKLARPFFRLLYCGRNQQLHCWSYLFFCKEDMGSNVPRKQLKSIF